LDIQKQLFLELEKQDIDLIISFRQSCME